MVQPIPKRGATTSIGKTLERINDFDLLSIFDPKRSKPYPRTVLVNVPLPAHAISEAPQYAIPGLGEKREEEGPGGVSIVRKVEKGYGTKKVPSEGWIFESNQVLTSKYNIFTFLPRNLLEQFRRVANVFFLGKSFFYIFSAVCFDF